MADVEVTSDDISRMMEKRNKRVARQAEGVKEFKEEVEKGEKKLVVECGPTGLYSLSFRHGGQVPNELRGKFTSISRIRERVIARYGKDILE